MMWKSTMLSFSVLCLVCAGAFAEGADLVVDTGNIAGWETKIPPVGKGTKMSVDPSGPDGQAALRIDCRFMGGGEIVLRRKLSVDLKQFAGLEVWTKGGRGLHHTIRISFTDSGGRRFTCLDDVVGPEFWFRRRVDFSRVRPPAGFDATKVREVELSIIEPNRKTEKLTTGVVSFAGIKLLQKADNLPIPIAGYSYSINDYVTPTLWPPHRLPQRDDNHINLTDGKLASKTFLVPPQRTETEYDIDLLLGGSYLVDCVELVSLAADNRMYIGGMTVSIWDRQGEKFVGVDSVPGYSRDQAGKWFLFKSSAINRTTDRVRVTVNSRREFFINEIRVYGKLAQDAQASAPCLLSEKGEGINKQITLENGYVKLMINPALGGTGVSLIHKKTGKELTGNEYLFQDLTWVPRKRLGDFSTHAGKYDYEIQQISPERVAVRLWAQGQSKELRYLRLRKTISLTRGSSAVHVDNEATFLPGFGTPIDYALWYHHTTLPHDEGLRWFIPTTSGVEILDGKGKGEETKENVARGWIGVTNKDRQGLVFTTGLRGIDQLYAWFGKGRYTCEWRYQARELQPGQSILNSYEVFPFAGLETISGASDGIALSISKPELMDGDVVRFTVDLAAARKIQGKLVVDTRVLPGSVWSVKTHTKDISVEPDRVGNFQFQFVLPGGTRTSALRVRLLEEGEQVVDAEQLILPTGELDQSYVYAPPPGVGKAIAAEQAKEVKRFKLLEGLQTPHVKWAQPYYRGKVKALVLTCLPAIREITELSNRMSLDVHTVPLGNASNFFDWLSRSLDQPMSLAEQLKILEEDLQKNEYDVIVLGGIPWGLLTKSTRVRITEMVRNGTGCVYVSPTVERYGDDNWPDFLPVGNHRVDDVVSGRWKKTKDHFLTRGIPFEGLPISTACRTPKVKVKSNILATIKDQPLLVTGRFGKGRVAALMYQTSFRSDFVVGAGLTPFLADTESAGASGGYWEYYYSWLAKCILWSAGREPEIELLEMQAPDWPKSGPLPENISAKMSLANNSGKSAKLRASAVLRDRDGQEVWQGEQLVQIAVGRQVSLEFKVPTQLRRGRHFLDVILYNAQNQVVNWGTVTFVAEPPARIAKFVLRNEESTPGLGTPLKQGEMLQGSVTVEVDASSPSDLQLDLQLVDAFGRVLWKQSQPVSSNKKMAFAAKPMGVITSAHFIDISLKSGNRQLDSVRKRVAIEQPPDLSHYEHNMWDGMTSELDFRAYFTPYYYKALREMGITAVAQSYYRGFPPIENVRVAEYGFKVSLNYLAHTAWDGFAIEAQSKYDKTGDWTKLVRRRCLNDPEEQKKMHNFAAGRVGLFARYTPFDCAVGDEGSITSYNARSDVCYSPHCLKRMRDWLKNDVYKTLDALNAQWGTKYKSWDKVRPLTFKEVQQRGDGNFAAWADHRTFMEITWANWQRLAGKAIHSKAPSAMIGIWGEANSEAYGGWDYWRLKDVLDIRLPRERGNLDHIVASFARPGTRWGRPRGSGFYGGGVGATQEDIDASIAWDMWMTFVVGNNIRQYWMGSYFFNISTLLPSASWAETKRMNTEVFGRGLGQLWVDAHRSHDGVVLHYSMPSIHAGFATGEGKMLSNIRDGWCKTLTELGYAPNFIASAQIEAGLLTKTKDEYRVLILPLSQAISDAEAAEIKRFMDQGGVVIATEKCGSMDEHCKPRKVNVLGSHKNLLRVAGMMDQFTFFYTRPNLAPSWPKVQALLDKAAEILAKAQANPAAEIIRPDGKPLTLCRRYRFVDWDGANEYLAMCRIWNLHKDVFQAKDQAEDVEVRFGRRAHVYDVVDGKYLGQIDRVKTSFGKSEGRVFALLPCKIGTMDVQAEAQVKRGDSWQFAVSFVGEENPKLRHAIRIDVMDPEGKVSDYYSRTEGFLGNQQTFRLPFALNDPTGLWKVSIRDTISGQSVTKTVVVNN